MYISRGVVTRPSTIRLRRVHGAVSDSSSSELKRARTPRNHVVLDRARPAVLRVGGERDTGEQCCVVKAERQALTSVKNLPHRANSRFGEWMPHRGTVQQPEL